MIKHAVILNDYCHINGGASRVAIDEAAELAAQGIKVTFISACGPVCDELEDVHVVCLGQNELLHASPAVALQGLWNRKAYRVTLDILRALNPADTIVHLHGYTKALSTSPLRAAQQLGFTVICTLHDFFAACPNGAFFNYTQSAPCPKRAMSLDCIATQCDKRHYGHKLYRAARTASQKLMGGLPNSVKHYITLSRHSASLLAPYLPPDAHYYPLENPIDMDKLPPVDVAKNQAALAVGRLDIEKGIETLLTATELANMPLILVGDGPLRPLAESYSHCRVTGWLPPQGVAEALQQARCLVFPSLWYETYGLVVAEAAARGVPAIVSDISAAAERVQHDIAGLHCHAGDSASLTNQLLRMKEGEAAEKMGSASYNSFWAAPPTRAQHVRRLLAIYAQALSNSGAENAAA